MIEGCNPVCLACKHRELTKSESLAKKQAFLLSKLPEYTSITDEIKSADESMRLGYRSKVLLAVTEKDGKRIFGMFRFDDIIDTSSCPVHHYSVNNIVKILAEELPPHHIFPLAFYSQSGKQVVLILKSKTYPAEGWLTKRIINTLIDNEIEGLWIHLNLSAGHRVYLKCNWLLAWGKPQSIDQDGFVYGAVSFRQLIPELYNDAMDTAEHFFNIKPGDMVIDLYCGSGSGLRRWIKAGADAVGVELGGYAVACAKINAPEAAVLRGKCAERIPQLDVAVRQKDYNNLYLYINPPRTGIEPEVSDWILTSALPLRIAYLSCSIGTLAKNLSLLTARHYKVIRIIPYDFFPQTIHQETLVLLERV